MAKIYFKKYKQKIDSCEITIEEAIDLAKLEVPERWNSQVLEMLNDL